MRLVIILILTLALTALIALFPEIAEQKMRIDAFGWLLETKQGAFIVVLLLGLGVVWFIQRLMAAAWSGPGQLWHMLRAGGRKRREAKLRENIGKLIDMRPEITARDIGRAHGIIPEWGLSLLRILATPAIEQEPPAPGQSALQTALTARMVTDPHAQPGLDTATCKLHLEAWLKASPNAPLAIARLPGVAEAEADWPALVKLLETAWQKGGSAAVNIKPRLARAYMELASEQAIENPDDAVTSLRKAYRLLPDSTEILLALGKAYIAKKDERAASSLWNTHLEKHDDPCIATALFELLKKDAMRAYRKLEKEEEPNPSRLWLRVQLARTAKLTGLAEDHMEILLEKHPSSLAWRTRGDWHAEDGNWQQAGHCYQQALKRR